MTIRIWWTSAIIILLAMSACKDSGQDVAKGMEPNYNPYILKPGRTFQSRTKTIHLDSLAKPDTVHLKKEILNLGKRISHPLQTNIQTAPEPKIYPLRRENHQLEPKTAQLTIKEVPLTWSAWEPANLIFQESGQFNFSYLDVNRGLKSNFVFCMLEDRMGNIWIGTWGGGVSIWDGKGFRHLTKENGLASNIVVHLMEDRHGNIWMAHYGEGVSMWDGKVVKQISFPQADQGSYIVSQSEDQHGSIWLGGNVLYKLNTHNQSWEALDYSHPAFSSIVDILKDHSGILWIKAAFVHHVGIYRWDGTNFTVYFSPQVSANGSGGLVQDKAGNIWIGTSEGLAKLQLAEGGDQPSIKLVSPYPNHGEIINLYEDSRGRFWVGEIGTGCYSWTPSNSAQPAQIQTFSRPQGLSNNGVSRFLEDQYGNFWIGTNGGGLNILRKDAFEHFALKNELASPFVYAILQSLDGNIILGNELSIWNQDRYQKFQSLSQTWISPVWEHAMDKDNKGNIWIGSRTPPFSILKWNYPQITSRSLARYRASDEVGIQQLQAIFVDKLTQPWFISQKSMYKGIMNDQGDLEALIPYSIEGDLASGHMYKDQQERVWITSEGSMPSFLHNNTHTYFTDVEHFKTDQFRSTIEDSQGNLWFASHDGLFIWNGSHFTHYTEEEGLLNNTLRHMTKDDKGNIWVGSVQGLTKFHWEEHERHWTMEHFESVDGMASPSINKLFVGQEQKLWMATTNGFSSLDLKKLKDDTLAPSLSIEEIQPLQGFVDWRRVKGTLTSRIDSLSQTLSFSFEGTNIDSIIPFTNLPANPIFPHHINDFSFRWSAKSKSPHRTQYSYMLERNGPGASWSSLVKENSADYRQLNHGRYVFKVRAVGSNGKWSETASYAFIIRPPWWKAWGAYVSYFLLGLILIWGLVRLQTYSLRVRVLEKTKEIRVQQQRSDELLLNILPSKVAHELKATGKTEPVFFEEVSIMFADFKGFTNIVASISGKKLVSELDDIFQAYDDIMEEVGLEKIQTVGDAYLAAGGLPTPDPDHAKKCVIAAQKIIAYLEKRNKTEAVKWKVRIGIHTGAITAGVIGRKKFSYDLFGDTINVAARIESASEPGRINISAMTYDQVKDDFPCTYRGKIDAKGKGELDMYFVDS